jgi:hypothetical protein
LTDFLNDYSAKDLSEYILPEIEKALDGKNDESEIGSETVSISVYISMTEFYDNNLNFVSEIPTADFRSICQGWRDFLIS